MDMLQGKLRAQYKEKCGDRLQRKRGRKREKEKKGRYVGWE